MKTMWYLKNYIACPLVQWEKKLRKTAGLKGNWAKLEQDS